MAGKPQWRVRPKGPPAEDSGRIKPVPKKGSSRCARHSYIVHHIDGKTVYVCLKCPHTIQ